MIYGECHVMLQHGRSHATSLIPALGMLADVSRTLSLVAGCPQQPASSQFQQYLGQILDRTLDLMSCMTSHFQDLSVGSSTTAGPSKFQCSLGKPLEAFGLQADQLLNEVWSYYIPSDTREPLVQLTQIQLLLQPHDEVVRKTEKLLHAGGGSRHEFTCEWFSEPFLDFVRGSDRAFWINGRVGCGKSVLWGWILESLQSAVNGREYTVVTYAIDSLLPSETKTTGVIKALLWQIIRCQHRSCRLYEALANLIRTSTTGDAPIQFEKALWECLEIAISEVEQPAMLVIDGLSELDGGETAATALFQNLLRFVAGNPLARLLVLSRPFSFSPKTPLRRRTIEARDVHKDMCRVITDLVPSHSPIPRVEIARRIDHEADGNFFWSLLAFQEWAAQNFSQQAWRTLPVSLEADVVSKLDFSDPVTCLVLFDSIIAIRPLRLLEIEVISRLDLNNRLLKSQAPDALRAVEEGCGSVLVVQEGIVLFRHAVLKQALFDMLQLGDLLLGPELHANIACRLLLYIKLVLKKRSSLTLKSTPSLALEDLFHAHPLLSYALSYWPKHAIASSMFSEPEDCKPNSVCLSVFPDTVYAATVEASFWRRDLSIESIRALQLAALMRKEILGDHEATLQTFACLAEALRCRKDFTSAANYFYKAAQIAQQALPEFHSFTATCMLNFLEVIEAADDSNIADLLSRKANVLRYMISMYDTQIGPSSDQALEFSNLLAAHYAIMQEYDLSTALSQHIHSLTIDRHGKDSSQAKVSAERLVTVLQYQSEEGASPCYESVNDDILQTYQVTDPRRIKALIAKAEDYDSLEEPFKAELVYVSLWHGVAESCSRQRNPGNHEKLLQCGVTYAEFLCKHGRISDSQNVLLGLWGQQQALGYSSANISALLVEVATEMRNSGLRSSALDVLYAALASSGIQDPDHVRKSISDITLDMIRDAQSNSTSEATLRRIVEAKKSQVLTPANVPIVNALITRLTDGNRFDDVVAIATEALNQLWPSVMDDSFDLTLYDSGPWVSELVQLAMNLGNAYMEVNQIDSTSRLYWRLFQIARKADAVDDSTTVEYANFALAAFEKTGQINRIIALREELLDLYVMRFGDRHSNTVEARYALASLYLQEQLFDKAKQQYFRILDPFRQPSFHELAALPALRGVIDVCSRQNCWDQAIEAYASLWSTFLTKGRDYGFDPSTSKALYEEYTTLLRKQDPVDIVRIHSLTEQYRTACTALWGERSSFTMEAVLWLAEMESRLHPDSIKAIRLYESLVNGEEGISPDQREDAKAIAEVAENRLTDFYQASINDGGQNIAKANHLEENIARAVRLQGKKYEREKTRRGASHPATLSNLAIWIAMLAKQDRSIAIQELKLALNSVMESDDQPSTLYDAAVILANSFSANSYREEGLNSVRGLTERVIFEDNARRSNLVLLTAFEAHLTDSTADCTKVHAKLLRISALWEQYRHVSQESTDPGLTIVCGARLRKFLIEHSYADRAILVEGDLYERFMEYYGAAFGQGIQTSREFFSVLLEELSNEKLEFETPNMPTLTFTALYNNASSLVGEGQYTTALSLLLPGFDFLVLVGAFAECSISVFEDGLRLGLMLAVPVDDQDTRTKMLNLSKKILQETLRQCRSQNLDFNVLPIDRISRVASVLGLQQNYEDLEVSKRFADQAFDIMQS